MKSAMKCLLVLGVWVWTIPQAHALKFSIINRSYGGSNTTAENTAFDTAVTALEATVNNTLVPAGTEDTFLGALADAHATSSKSLGVDYTSEINRMMVGVQLAGALAMPNGTSSVSGRTASTNSLPQIGVGAGTVVTVGVPATRLGIPQAGKIDPKRLVLFGHAMYLPLDDVAKGVSLLHASMGVTARYQLLVPKGKFPARWNGVRVSTGVRYALTNVTFNMPLNLNASGGGTTLVWGGTMDLGVVSWLVSIPSDISTSVQLFGFLTPFMGLGLDINDGATHTTGSVQGPVRMSAGSGTFNGTGVLDGDLGDSLHPSFFQIREFFGVAFEFSVVKLTTQATLSTNHTIAGLVSLAAAW